jgi:predicted RNA-binding protein associated with RNAse of E/G family
MLGGKNISEGYVGITMDVYNKYDNIDFYNIIKKDNPKTVYLYGMNKTIKINNINLLNYIENKENYIAKKIKRGNFFIVSSRINFRNELNSIKKIFKFMKNKLQEYTTIKPLFTYNNIDIYALSYKKNYFIFQEKCFNTLDKIKFTQKEFDKMIKDIHSSLELLQTNNFLHNDLKADNIIYCNNKYKIIDWDKSYHTKFSFKSLFIRGNFLFNHPYKFYNKGIPLFLYNFLNFIFKKIDYKTIKWVLILKSFKIMEEKIAESIDYLIHNPPKNINKYYDNFSFALLIIFLAEKNNIKYSKEFVNNLLKPFHIII